MFDNKLQNKTKNVLLNLYYVDKDNIIALLFWL